MSARLFRQTLRWHRWRLLALGVAGLAWGALGPVIYNSFGDSIRELARSGIIPEKFLRMGSGNLFTLPGTLALGLHHPLSLAFLGVFAIGAAAGAVAGERERGTLEVLLARPLSRRRLYVTLAAAMGVLISIELAAILVGHVASAAILGLTDQIELTRVPLVFVNGLMLWCAFGAFSLAASVSFDRRAPALGASLAYLLLAFFLQILGELWDAAAWLQQYSLFHHFGPGAILEGNAQGSDFMILGIAIVIPVCVALVVFPRRDIAAPS
jgi:ABC-2 type transport system permease protein